MEYSELSKINLMDLLAQAYQVLSDKKEREDQIATINRRVHQTLNKPVGFQGVLKWVIPAAVFLIVHVIVYSVLGIGVGIISGGFAAYYAYNYSSGKKDKALAKDKVAQYRQLASKAKNELEIYQASDAFIDSLEFLLPEMKDIYAVAALYNILNSGRADNWKEAINKYDTEIHRFRQEQNQQEIINNQKRQMLNAEQNNILLNRITTSIGAQNAMIATQITQIDNITKTTTSIGSDINAIKNR